MMEPRCIILLLTVGLAMSADNSYKHKELKYDAPSSNHDQYQLKDLAMAFEKLIERFDKMEQQHSDMLIRVNNIENLAGQTSQVTPNNNAVFSAFGCRMEIITISCTSSRTITINNAYFGQYFNRLCADTCCVPHPTDDCTESLEEEGPAYWELLTETCNNRTTCTFEVPTATVNSCQDPYIAEYMNMQYLCTPYSIEKGIGFTAWAQISRSYEAGNVVIFESVMTNIGGHYAGETSLFTCPVKGTYVFSTALSTYSPTTYGIVAYIMHEGQHHTTCHTGALYDQCAATAVLVCDLGGRVWIEVIAVATELLGWWGYRYTFFTGFLLEIH